MPLKEVEGLLTTLLEKLGSVKAPPGSAFEPPLRKIREVQELISVASRPNWSYLREKLREIDDDVSAAVVHALSPSDLEEFRDEAARAIERHRGRVDEEALSDAMARYTLQRARERLATRRPAPSSATAAAWTKRRFPTRWPATRSSVPANGSDSRGSASSN